MTALRKALAAALCLVSAHAFSASTPRADRPADYPNKPIRLVVPSAPGGGTDIVRLLNKQTIRERFTALGLVPSPSTPEEFSDILRREIPIWHKVAKQASIRIE